MRCVYLYLRRLNSNNRLYQSFAFLETPPNKYIPFEVATISIRYNLSIVSIWQLWMLRIKKFTMSFRRLLFIFLWESVAFVHRLATCISFIYILYVILFTCLDMSLNNLRRNVTYIFSFLNLVFIVLLKACWAIIFINRI